MLSFIRASLLIAALVAVTSAPCLAGDTVAQQNEPPATLDGTVKLKGGVVGAGVGYKWGHGTLTYQGQQLQFCIHGLSVGDVGAASVDAQGNVYNLKDMNDFTGRYLALSGGFAFVRGESAAILKNKHGVMLELEMLESGLRFNIAATGLKVTFAGQHGCKER
jgi:hypothetical protein